MKIMKGIKNAVKYVLINNINCRDSDQLLYVYLVEYYGLTNLSVKDVLLSLNYQTVRTARQQLQKEFPELRGVCYKFNQKSDHYCIHNPHLKDNLFNYV